MQGIVEIVGVWRGVPRRAVDGHRLPALLAGHPSNGRKVNLFGVARPQGVEGKSRAGPGQTLGSPRPPLLICPRCRSSMPIKPDVKCLFYNNGNNSQRLCTKASFT
jgi:hypothetical protein